MVERDLRLAQGTGAKIVIQHISTKEAVELVRRAKEKGMDVHAEATPHHFTLTQKAAMEKGTMAKMNPPLRSREDRERAQFTSGGRNPMYQWGASNMTAMVPYWFLKAYHMGLVERDVLYKGVLNYFHRGSVLQAICQMVKGEYKRLGNRQRLEPVFWQ